MRFQLIFVPFFVSGVIAGGACSSQRHAVSSQRDAVDPHDIYVSPQDYYVNPHHRCINDCLAAAKRDGQDLHGDHSELFRVFCVEWCKIPHPKHGGWLTTKDIGLWRKARQGAQWKHLLDLLKTVNSKQPYIKLDDWNAFMEYEGARIDQAPIKQARN